MADYEPRGITVRDVAAADFIKAYAEHLKNTGRVELPSWCDLVKTAPHKEMCPCLLYTSPSPRDATLSRMPSSA